ncbi:3D domain-containing protein [Sporosarcina gallistercoris]|uniref:3D domain-containing protein n=1 Tax=Sporosarcina gallistercoris TaxID=2762245 RepID=UPI003D2BECA4
MKKLIFTFILATALMVSGSHESSAAASTYKVKKGDSLYKISRMYNVSVNNLMKWNGIKSSVIYPNQTLKLVSGGATTAAKKPVNKPSRSDDDNVSKEFMANSSAYTASCKGCSGITKTGLNLKKNPSLKVIAVDPLVIPLGSKVHVEGYGYAVAGDIGGAIKGNRIDVFMASHSQAIQWGRKSVRVKVLN